MAILRYRAVGASTWHDVPNPKTFSWGLCDIDDSERSQDGAMHRERIAIKRKLECTWEPMNDNQMSQLLNCMTLVFFELEYPDALVGKRRTSTFYVGDRKTPMYIHNKNGGYLWGGLKANFVEK